MATRIGINGFGRIGRSVLRILTHRDDIEVVAVNDLFENDQLAYLLKYDTVMGVLKREVRLEGSFMYVDGQKIAMTGHRDPAEIPWKEMGVDIVVEATGVFRKREPLERHLAAGASKVLLTVPAKDPIDATIVLGVNDDDLRPEHKIVFGGYQSTWQRELHPPVSILFDFGAIYEGYCYDFGRTVIFGEPDVAAIQVHELVMASQDAGIKAMRAEQVTASEVDAAARNVIHEAGLGEAFRHRLGHGIGLFPCIGEYLPRRA